MITETTGRGCALYDKYLGASTQFRTVYSKFSESERSDIDRRRNLTGYIVNLSSCLKQSGIENTPLTVLKEKHLAKDFTKSQQCET